MKTSAFAIALAPLFVLACKGTLPPPDLDAHKAEAHATEQGNLLLYPVADAEDLLGRPVHVTKDGAWTISDARNPGCNVEVKKQASQYKAKRQVDVESLTSMSAGFNKLISAQAKFGRANKADIDIDNTQIYRADVSGPCGDNVVDTVFVGHGSRKLLASAEQSMGVEGAINGITPKLSADGKSKLVDELEWKDDQAYGFSYKKMSNEPALEVTPQLPSFLTEGQKVEVKLESNRKAWIVVYYLDGTGKGDVLWPSNEEQFPTVEPDKPAVLPSAAEQKAGIVIKASLLKPGEASRETFVVYAFADKADFDRLKPRAGGSDVDGAMYAGFLSTKIGSVPRSRWSRSILSYVITPAGSPKK
jgi:hypothetical protein